MDTCIYCQQLNQEPSAEHVIADALGGSITLKSTDVCKPCNNVIDQQIDRHVQACLKPILAQLEIPGKRGQLTRWTPTEVVAGETRRLEVTRAQVGAAENRKLLRRTDETYEFRASSIEELERARDEIETKHPNKDVRLGDIVEKPLAVPDERRDEVDFSDEAWSRWAAKSCLNVICYTFGNEVASRAEFDGLRDHALGRTPSPGGLHVGGVGNGDVYVDELPAEHRIHVETDGPTLSVQVELFGYCACVFTVETELGEHSSHIVLDAVEKKARRQ